MSSAFDQAKREHERAVREVEGKVVVAQSEGAATAAALESAERRLGLLEAEEGRIEELEEQLTRFVVGEYTATTSYDFLLLTSYCS